MLNEVEDTKMKKGITMMKLHENVDSSNISRWWPQHGQRWAPPCCAELRWTQPSCLEFNQAYIKLQRAPLISTDLRRAPRRSTKLHQYLLCYSKFRLIRLSTNKACRASLSLPELQRVPLITASFDELRYAALNFRTPISFAWLCRTLTSFARLCITSLISTEFRWEHLSSAYLL